MGSTGNPLTRAWSRLYILATGRVEWVGEDGGVDREKLSWRTRWSIVGVHSYNWKWVRRYGKRVCGCTFNPITRRKVLTRMDCSQHGISTLVEGYHGKAKTQ